MTETEHIDKDKPARKEAQTIPMAREEHISGLLYGETGYRDTHLNQTFRTKTNSENTNTPTTEEEHKKKRHGRRQRLVQEQPN